MTGKTNPYARSAQAPEREAGPGAPPGKRVTPRKVLLAAVAANFIFMGAYFSLGSLSAAEEKGAQQAPPAVVRKEPVQDVRVQLDTLRQREELLRVRQRELQLLEKRIDEKIRRLSVLETNVKAEIAAYRGISDERTKHLVKIYSSMKPKAAATLMDQMDIEVATEVFLSMKGEIAGGILASMEPVKAAAISKRLMSSRKMSSPAAPQALPQAAPQVGTAESAATGTPAAAAQIASAPAVKPSPKAKVRPKSWVKAKPWSPPAPVAAKAAAPQAVGQGAAPLAAAAPAPREEAPRAAATPTASSAPPQPSPQPAPQASAAPAGSPALARTDPAAAGPQ